MYLYEQKRDMINIYNYNINSDQIIEFKRKELEKIPKNERVIFFTKEVDSSFIFFDAVKRLDTFAITERDLRLLADALEIFDEHPIEDDKIKSQTLESFLQGELHDSFLVKLPKSYYRQEEQYFISACGAKDLNDLMTRTSNDGFVFDCKTSPVIQLTEKLYSLQLLLQDNLDRFLKDDVTEDMLELMSLFEFTEEPVKQFHIKTLNELCQFGLLPESTNSKMMQKINQSSLLLQKIKKRK